MTLDETKAALKSALRAVRVRDGATFNTKMALVTKALAADESLAKDPDLAVLVSEAEARAKLYKAETSMTEWCRFLLACQEPQKALTFLKECRPEALKDAPHLNAMQTRIERGLRHLNDWDAYKEFYGTPTYYSTFDISTGTDRGRAALEAFKTLPAGAKVLCIGPNDGLLERRLLETTDATLVVAEIASTFDDVLGNLQEEFPGRVSRHSMTDFYDWAPIGAAFDLVILFEVLEHLPDERDAVYELGALCREGGTVMVSVPVGHCYIETAHADDVQYQHVRAFTEGSLRDALELGFGDVTITRGVDRTFVATCRRPL